MRSLTFSLFCFFCFLFSVSAQEVVTQSSSDYEELRDAFLQANLPELNAELPLTTPIISIEPSISTLPWYNEFTNSQSSTRAPEDEYYRQSNSADYDSQSTTEYPPHWHNFDHYATQKTTDDPDTEIESSYSTTEYPNWPTAENEQVRTTDETSTTSTMEAVPPTWFNDQLSWNIGHTTTQPTVNETGFDETEEEDEDSDSALDKEVGGEPIGLAEPTAPAKTLWETIEHVVIISSTTSPHTTGLMATVEAWDLADSVLHSTETPVESSTVSKATATEASMVNVTSENLNDSVLLDVNNSTTLNNTLSFNNSALSDIDNTLSDFATWSGNHDWDILNTTQRVTDLGNSMSDDEEELNDGDLNSTVLENFANATTSTTHAPLIKPTLLPIYPTSRRTADLVESSTVTLSVHPDQASQTVLLFEKAVHIYGLVAFGLAVLGTVLCCCLYGCCCKRSNRRRQYTVNGDPKGVSDPLLGI